MEGENEKRRWRFIKRKNAGQTTRYLRCNKILKAVIRPTRDAVK